MEIKWEQDSKISVRIEGGATVISANKAGLKSLSKIFSDLADGKAGDHIHLDKFNSLDDGSEELIVEKVS